MTYVGLISYFFSGKFYRKAWLLAILMISAFNLFGQVPIIDYGPPVRYNVGQTISLSPNTTRGGDVPPGLYGNVTTIAGSGAVTTTDGRGTAAAFNKPQCIAQDAAGNLYVTEQAGKVIRKITPAGDVTILTGKTTSTGDLDGALADATFSKPFGVVVDSMGDIFVSDDQTNSIRKINMATGQVSTFAVAASGFVAPRGMVIDKNDNIYVANSGTHQVKKVAPDGTVTNFAGSGTPGGADGINGQLVQPKYLSIDANGTLYVTSGASNVIRMINSGGEISTLRGLPANPMLLAAKVLPKANGEFIWTNWTTSLNQIILANTNNQMSVIAGKGNAGSADGIGAAATFDSPQDMIYGIDGHLYVVDANNNKIRKVEITGYAINSPLPGGLSFDRSGVFSGTPTNGAPAFDYKVTAYNADGKSDPVAINIAIDPPPAVAKPILDYQPATRVYYVGDQVNIHPEPAGGGAVPAKDYASELTDVASLPFPWALANDKYGYLYSSQFYQSRMSRINTTTGSVEEIAGNSSPGRVDGTGNVAKFTNPSGIAVDADGSIYVVDKVHNGTGPSHHIVKLTWGAPATVTMVSADFIKPHGIAIDAAGNFYVSDQGTGSIKRVDRQTGSVTTFATGFQVPSGMDIDAAGNIYVADAGSTANNIKKITPAGVVSVFKDGLVTPRDVKVDGSGNCYVTDELNNPNGPGRVIMITPAGDVTTIANTSNEKPIALSLDKLGNLYIGYQTIIKRINISGYKNYSTVALPNGLSFDTKTGIISGVPTEITPEREYVITAYNGGGSSTFKLKIAVERRQTQPALSPPIISYVNPPAYTVNKSITPLVPTNTGGDVPKTVYGSITSFQNNLNNVGSVAVGPDGFIYVCETGANQIRKIDPVSKQMVDAYTGFSAPTGIAVGADGNIYVSEQGTHLIRKISTSGIVTVFAGSGSAGLNDGTGTGASFNKPGGLAVDADGNVYVADEGNNFIRKISPAGVVTKLNTGALGAPADVAFDKLGNLYFSEVGDGFPGKGSVKKMDINGIITVYKSGLDNPRAIEIDGNGNNLYVNGNQRISKPGEQPVTIPALTGVIGSAFNADGSLFVTEPGYRNSAGLYTNGTLKSVDLTGYTSTPGFPRGLTFDPTTGVLSGRPQITSPAFNYTVIAFNAAGSSSFTISIAINSEVLTSQTITFPAISSKFLCDGPFMANATSTNSTIPITYASSDNAIATVDATGQIIIKATGTVTITASQAGNTSYSAAVDQKKTFTITGPVKPSFAIHTGKASYCVGELVEYIVTDYNLSSLPSITYQWQVNGVNVPGETRTNFFVKDLRPSIDKVQLVVTNTENGCPAVGTAEHPARELESFKTLAVTVTSSATGPVCAGADITFTATATPDDNATIYQWHVNGVNVGTNSKTYANNNFKTGDVVTCTVTNTAASCLVKPDATSTPTAPLTVIEPASPAPTVTITASATSVYAENPITFTAVPENTSGTVTYQWQINGVNAGTNSATFTSTRLKNADKVSVIMTAGTCAVPAKSNDIFPTIMPPLSILPPNAFSPNGDGVNDLWLISGLNTYPNCVVNVYNRNGESVFRSKGYSQPWDGLYKSTNLPTGTYYYVIDLANGKPRIAGYISLVR